MPRLTASDLDRLAVEIADVIDRGDYGIDVDQDDIRPELAAFLAAAARNGDRNHPEDS